MVDAHQHVWDLAAHDQPWLRRPGNEPLLRDYAEADLRPLAAAAGVGATVVVQTVTEPGETQELLALAAASDLVAGVVGWADLASGQAAADLAALAARRDGSWLRGIRHPVLTEPDPAGWLERPEVRAGLAAVGAAGLCFDLVLPPGALPAAAAAAGACPGTTFVLDHLGNPEIGARPDEEWVTGVRAVAALPNTACKLSGILSAPAPGGGGTAHLVPYYEIVLAAFGPARLMFGSDWPVCTLGAAYGQVVAAARELTAGLGRAERAAVLGGTARRVYGLGPG